ncbi:hypothetical protein [Streptomyces endophytica]|uniref:LPXTG cell wall anchor domain-containing protein n=1 Tax=Streptomyces endophytica TaxID=2991496 RepID=A0ABY6P7T7_9ACTN|nr:hypothetical protein [Streptomyces endophytica]UZJ29846.1 hypothetical protein OJ254_04550 [Streptomyces endophytica]
MTARRPLLTAAAAGSVLFALWFVPSAHAIVGASGPDGTKNSTTAREVRTQSVPAKPAAAGAPRPGQEPGAATAPAHSLADTGTPDTTPYVIGGAACLALGAGLVSYSVRRGHGGAF